MNQHGFNLEELDSMMPWEREIYVSLLRQHVKEVNERTKQTKGKMNG
ncbi:MAG TPA: baseplate protein [Saprospirales bacterium]|jgi:hypothetical protein|nr:baseplate protein [Saprospirales bacterium]|tara:strand:- start:2762 stop:2902 length:141 start_codon:yes stop_codon:yes gene_type:complete